MWSLLLACSHPTSPSTTSPPTEPPRSVLTVSSYFGDTIHLFAPDTGEVLGKITGLDGPQTVVVGPDGAWVACSELANQIVTIDPATATVTGALVADDPATEADETGGLVHPDAAAFGPDGRLYVSSFETDAILRYEADGTFVDAVIPAGLGGLDGPDLGLGFDPDGNLVVPGYYSDRIHRYDPSGAPLADLLGPEDGLDAPREVVYDAAGRAYVSAFGSDAVFRVATDGAVERFDVPGAAGLAIDEAAGVLFVASGGDDTVRALDLATGVDQGIRIDFRPLDAVTAIRLLSVP